MSFLSALARAGRGIASVSRGLLNAPVVGTALKALPVIGTAATIADVGLNLFGPSSSSAGLPALPTGGAGLPALPGAGAPSIVGNRSIFRNDPNIVAALQPFAISMHNLKASYRSPIRGYVIRHDQKGDPYAIPKTLAKQYLGWKPKAKPPISVRDWHALQHAHHTVKVLNTIVKKANAIKGVHVAPPHHTTKKGGRK